MIGRLRHRKRLARERASRQAWQDLTDAVLPLVEQTARAVLAEQEAKAGTLRTVRLRELEVRIDWTGTR